MILAGTFLSLQDQGVIDLTVERSKKLFVTSSKVKVTVNGGAAPSAMAGSLLTIAQQRNDMTGIVDKWVVGRYAEPRSEVLTKALGGAAEVGRVEREDAHRNMLSRPIGGKFKPVLPEDRSALINPPAEVVAERCKRFTSDEAELSAELLKKIQNQVAVHESKDD